MKRISSSSAVVGSAVAGLSLHGCLSNAALSADICSQSRAAASPLVTAKRGRFYKPLVNQGINLWRFRMGRLHKGWSTWEYNHDVIPDPRPFPEPAVNNYYGRTRIWNPIAGKIGLVNRKAEEWGWPHRRPPPTGLRRSPEYFPFFFDRYFPSEEVRLVLDSVLNNETTYPVFHIPQNMSKQELVNYLKHLYHIDNVVRISVRNVRGKRFKNEVGQIKSMPDYKVAVVELDAPVSIELKQFKGTEDTPDNKPQAQIS
ncbi:hypothetical protein ABL78_2573 [Leptomonas seymouri]|uniref:Uncharacterized protein n=1 Tax=Leptomonas seymouri TaxID=5684 RepID=A0A0N1I5Z4_LEPSE|nr:hypothetical protein ABL78_2573 [Leptomonas seymouri]|eukprot:KPI88334.1 hypothetical protein ABL78_2573 [Leptomonas seymouri]